MIRFNGEPWSAYAKSIKPDELKAWRSTDPVTWANESYKLALSHAYATPKDGRLGPEYFQRNLPIVERRLKMAGVRLAALLNNALDDEYLRRHITLTTALIRSGVNGTLDLFRLHLGRYPTSLSALVEPPEDDEEAKRWRGPYIKKAYISQLKDAWGNDLIYSWPGEHNEESYDLSSPGPDGIAGNADDIVNWKR